ncbi:MAG: hypothetical protein NVS9B14_19270 [Candidatus Acidiferrum sp.]
MRILVTFAVEAEFAPWLSLRKFRKQTLIPKHYEGGWEVYETESGANKIWVVLTGMGSQAKKDDFLLGVRAKEAGVDAFVSSGLAGSLRKEHVVGEVIVPERIGNLREATGIPASLELLGFAKQSGAKIVDTLLTSDHIVETSEEKERLAFFGDAVDMESESLMRKLAAEGIPSVTVRAISDASDEDLPIDFSQCLSSDGKVKPMPLLERVFRRPSKIPALIRFGTRSKKAAANLAKFLDSFTAALRPETIKADLGVAAE